MARIRQALNVRFEAKVDRNGPTVRPELGPCWLWTGATLKGGYGNLKVNGRTTQAHRISWLLHRGPLAEGVQVLHRCDTPGCVNPEHLFVGDQLANMRDAASKGRTAKRFGDEHWTHRRPDDVVRGDAHPWASGDHARGEANVQAKLTAADVQAIRAEQSSYGYCVRLGQLYGVSPSTIRSIRRGETWAHVA